MRLVPLLGAMVMLAGMNAIGADPRPPRTAA